MFYKFFLLCFKISECNSVDSAHYQRNRDMILNKAKDYYKNDKERLREQTRDKYRNLYEEEKNKKRVRKKTDTTICQKKKNKD